MTNINDTTTVQRLEAAAVRLAEAEREYAAQIAVGIAEDAADRESGLSAAVDALVLLTDDALAGHDAKAAFRACVFVAEAGLPVRDDAADLIMAMAA